MAETVGSLVDKISIVELKIYHMQEQVVRLDVSDQHRHQCRLRIDVLKQQRIDLEQELTELYRDVLSGRRQMKVYRQFKMYNDPAYRIRQK